MYLSPVDWELIAIIMCLSYYWRFNMLISKNALAVLEKRYFRKNEKGEVIENAEEMFKRVAKAIAEVEKNHGKKKEEVENIETEFYSMMSNLEFLPNSPTLMGAGTENPQLSACFVLPVEDSMEGIFTTIKNAAVIHQSGGGCVKAGTKVFTYEKGITTIDYLVKNNFSNIHTLSYDQEKNIFTPGLIKEYHTIEVKNAYKVTLIGGGTNITSDWHPYFVFDGEKIITKRADELNKDDAILCPSLDTIGKKIHNDSYAWFLGFIIGDGCIDKLPKRRVRCWDQNKITLNNVRTVIKKEFNSDVCLNWDKKDNCFYTVLQNKSSCDKITKDLEYNFHKNTYKIPVKLISSDSILPFIAGLFDADGCTMNKEHKISLELVNEIIIKQVKEVLSLFGIKSSYRTKKTYINKLIKTVSTMHCLTIAGYDNMHRFIELVGKHFVRLHIAPLNWSNEQIAVSKNIESKSDYTTTYYSWKNGFRKALSIKRLLNILRDDRVKFLLNKLVKIKKVEQVTGGVFYDFTIDKYQNYAATYENGFMMVHNTGFSFGKLRPKNDKVKTTGGVASGPISFMKVFDAATEAVKQGGKRRGANIGILPANHPDIFDFIKCKNEDKLISNFNISIMMDDKFMKAVEKNKNYDLINPRNAEVTKTVKAKEIFDLIVDQAWKNGEPGILFYDRINEDNPTPELGAIEATNPCSELPLTNFSACNLGSINLTKIVKDDKIDWNKFETLIILAVRFLDNVIDACKFPLKEIDIKVKEERKIGLGIMGFADMLIMLGIKYNSKESYKLISKLGEFLRETADTASKHLAKEKGSFPVIKKSIYKDKEMRNATRLTIAPTGTLSILANCSSSIEPIFSVAYTRTIMDGQKFIEVNPIFESKLKEVSAYSEKLIERVSTKHSIQEMEEIPKEIRELFVTAHDVKPDEHIKVQALFQEHIDNSISKTVNLSNSATKEDVENIIMNAWESGCKGVTVYRDGSREAQVLSVKGLPAKEEPIFKEKYRPDEYNYGKTHQCKTAECGKILLTVNGDSKESIRELICTMGKSGDCITSHQEALFKMASHLLRYGIPLKVVIKSLKGIGCPKPTFYKEYGCSGSCLDWLARKLEIEYNKEIVVIKRAGVRKCPECQAILTEGNCDKCSSCGWSSCGS